MFHQDMLAFNQGFTTNWDDWVANAPPSWEEDGFLTTRRPITVLCRYGQNQPIANENSLHANSQFWSCERDYQKI
jgi:hypothetical protein